MDGGTKVHWKAVRVGIDGAAGVASVFDRPRLAALQRWHSGAAAGASFFDAAGMLTSPHAVDWTDFPEFEALAALFEDELRRFQGVLQAEPPRSERASL